MPNKLVKRSVSQRGLSHDEARGQVIRRPATSHQRSQTFRDILARPNSYDTNEVTPNILTALPQLDGHRETPWRPYFGSGFPHRRRRSESATDSSQIRVISLSAGAEPFMLRGTDLDASASSADLFERPAPEWIATSAPPITSRRYRRSLSSLRRTTRPRNFTDAAVQVSRVSAIGTISPVQAQNHITLSTDFAASNGHVRLGSSSFASSPPISHFDRRVSLHPRDSISASDPPTTGSDADNQIFSDQESIDFKSDTAYDSIATRTTNASGSIMKESGLETIFAARTSDEADAHLDIWRDLKSGPAEVDHDMSDSPFDQKDPDLQGIGIAIGRDKQVSVSSSRTEPLLATPPQSASLHTEDFSVTPVPLKVENPHLDSSPPYLPVANIAKDYDRVGEMLEDMKLDEDDEIDWSAEDDCPAQDVSIRPSLQDTSLSSPADELISRFQEPAAQTGQSSTRLPRPSILDWSDPQLSDNSSRPKTVHGKQANVDRSRSSGRKGPPQLHFRSQSVPINRDPSKEELPTASKYKTWRLGAKPVSEEWSDDFEFDDADEEIPVADRPALNEEHNFRDSVRSVRIPQSIIDRQPSVHLQFGQVQEFMALVEELKRLRSSGASLQILNANARNLWEDAESIINLATINDEDVPLASSPLSSDPFAELQPPSTGVVANGATATRGRRPTTSGRRSVSAVTTPPVHGRARGESLAQARHFLQVMHQNRGAESSPREIEIHHQKKLPFDTQDLKDLVVRSRAITKALKEEVRRAEGISVSPCRTPQSKREEKRDDPFNESFWKPEPVNSSPSPAFRTKSGLPKSCSAHGCL